MWNGMLYKSGPKGSIRESYALQHVRTCAGRHQTNQCNPAKKIECLSVVLACKKRIL